MAEQAKDKKIKVDVVTLSGDYSHKYDDDTLLSVVVADAVKHLKLVTDDTWILEFDGQPVSANLTLMAAGVKDGDELEYHAPEGGGGSRG
jgi:hypothetical protein